MEPYWTSQGVTLHLGDVRECLQSLPSQTVHCVVTSPPYWKLRSYHNESAHKHLELGAEELHDCLGWATGMKCGDCYVCHLVLVFREVRRVLRSDGVCWLNLGDTYAGGGIGGGATKGAGLSGPGNRVSQGNGRKTAETGLPSGNLVGVPWRTALALQADGWVLRSDLPWVKRSAMPESVTNRPAKSLEYVFMLTKQPSDYYFDMDAIRPASVSPPGAGGACFGRVSSEGEVRKSGGHARRYDRPDYSKRGFRNGDLWFQSVSTPHGAVGIDEESVGLDVTPSSAPGGGNKKLHFAVFPQKLVAPLVMAGTSEAGCCGECGAPLRRIVTKSVVATRPAESGDRAAADSEKVAMSGLNDGLRCGYRERESDTAGWRRTCRCRTELVVPCVVLDPFVGSGTTVVTSLQLGRHSIGIDLSEVYLRDHAVPRISAALAGEELSSRKKSKPFVVPTDCDPPPPPRALRLK